MSTVTVVSLPGDLNGLHRRQNWPHMTAWQRIGSICTTDSAAGPEKLRQKAMAKSIHRGVHRKNEGGFPKDRARSARENFAN